MTGSFVCVNEERVLPDIGEKSPRFAKTAALVETNRIPIRRRHGKTHARRSALHKRTHGLPQQFIAESGVACPRCYAKLSDVTRILSDETHQHQARGVVRFGVECHE